MQEPPHTENWIDWFKNFALLSVPVSITFWKLIDAYFAAQSKKDREFIKSVVDESISANMREFREDLKDIKQTLDQDRKDNSREIQALTKEVYKQNRG